MAYATKREMSSSKTPAIVVVVLLHVALGYVLITGLATNFVKQQVEDLNTFDVEEEPPPPPPPEEEPPPPEPQPQPQVESPPPPVVSPPPIVRTNQAPPPVRTAPSAPPPRVTTNANPRPPAPPAPPAPPPPPPPPRIEPASAQGDVRGLFSVDDYPSRALRNGDTGTARAELTIGTNGRVSGCRIVQSTGSSALDDATCKVLTRRARFNPATDSTGAKVQGSYTTPAIRWELAE